MSGSGSSRDSRAWWIAAGISVLVTILAIFFRPLWLDEYWTHFIAGGDTSWEETFRVRFSNDIHPPLVYLPLHVLDALLHSDLAARLLNLVYLGLGFALAWRAGRDRPAETALYLCLSVTAFWFTFYGVEIRNYALLYALSVAAVPVLRRTIEGERLQLPWLVLWTALGMATGLTHYYGTFWIGATGLVAGVSLLISRRPRDFFFVGVASTIAVAPALIWVAVSHFSQSMANAHLTDSEGLTWGSRIMGALTQIGRGLIGKTLAANIPAAIIAFTLGGAVLARRERNDLVLLLGPALVLAGAMIVMMLTPSDIRERSLTPLIPPLLYFTARALSAAERKTGRTRTIARLAPYAAALAPLIFIPEHFKDRQRYPQVQTYLAHTKTCAGEPVLATLIPMPQQPAFPLWYARAAIAPTPGGPPVLIDAATATPADFARVAASPCPVKAVGLALARGDGIEQQRARDGLRAAGFRLDSVREDALGGGRNLIWVRPDYEPPAKP